MHKEAQEGKGARKHSICLGISSVVSVLVLLYELFYIVMSYQESASQSIGTQIGTKIGITIVLPHVFFVFLATVFLLISFFTNGLGFCITAGVLFSVSAVLMLSWSPFVIPSIILTFIGCAFCHKKKVEKQEAEEEQRYRKEHPAPQVQHERASFAQRTANQRPSFERSAPMQANAYGTGMQTNPYQSTLYPQAPYPGAPFPQDPYSPITPMQAPIQGAVPYAQPVYPAMNQVPIAPVQAPYPQYGEAQPSILPPQQSFIQPQPVSQETVSTGYFDDFGNFHSGQSSGNF